MANVMNALPEVGPAGGPCRACAEVRDAEDREHAEKALDGFIKEYEAKWPKATEKMVKDRPRSCSPSTPSRPSTGSISKTTNPIESTFATVRLRTKVTKGPGSRAAGLAMAYKLIEAGPDPVAGGQRTPPGRSGPGRRDVREGGDGRAN